jgi:cytochrome subunit of sulfide dehydrogenase
MPALPSRILGLVALLLCLPCIALAADPRAALLADSCAACHGPDGQSPGAMPPLHGRSADFLAQRLKEFKTDQRPGTVMNRLAKGYSDEEIALIATYLGTK